MFVRVFDAPKYGRRPPQFRAECPTILRLRRAILQHRRDMQPGNLGRAPVIQEYKDVCRFRMYCCMIGRRNDILTPIARSNGKRLKWHGVQ